MDRSVDGCRGGAVASKLVEEHGGDMTFAAADGGGTVVTLGFARDPLAHPRFAEVAE